jgi:hypothetical protein
VTPKRTRQLSATTADGISPDDVLMDDELPPGERLDPEAEAEAAAHRQARFTSGISALEIGAAGGIFSERLLLLLAGIVAPLGLVVVVLGWWGASQTPYEFEQVPYLISGGLLGLGLVFVGSFFYFAHWMTTLVKEHREQSRAILDALERLADLQEDGLVAVQSDGRRRRRAS